MRKVISMIIMAAVLLTATLPNTNIYETKAATKQEIKTWKKNDGKAKKVKNIKVTQKNKKVKVTNPYTNEVSYQKNYIGAEVKWDFVKGASFYTIERWAPAQKKWIRIKKITAKYKKKKNKGKVKNKYVMKEMFKSLVEIRVTAYKRCTDKNGKRYIKQTNPTEFEFYTMTTCQPDGSYFRTKPLTDQFACEYAFVMQNEIRKEEGVKPLVWSNILYDIGVYRTKTTGYSHKNAQKDVFDYAKSQGVYLPRENSVLNDKEMCYGENLCNAAWSIEEAINGWKNSGAHFGAMTDPENKYGAIAFYYSDDFDEGTGLVWIATFTGRSDFEDYWNSFKK